MPGARSSDVPIATVVRWPEAHAGNSEGKPQAPGTSGRIGPTNGVAGPHSDEEPWEAFANSEAHDDVPPISTTSAATSEPGASSPWERTRRP